MRQGEWLRARVSASNRGSVTAELAVTLPALTVMLALLLLAAMVGVTQLRVEEAARSTARSLARGESFTTAASTAKQVAGETAQMSVEEDGNLVHVHVTARLSGPLSGLITWPLTATAIASRESVPGPVGFQTAGPAHSS